MNLIQRLRVGFLAIATVVMLAGPSFALPGASPANRRPKMPPKPPILGIPNGGRQAAFQPGHGAFGNIQGQAAGQTGQAGQAGQGGLNAGNQGGAAAFGQFGMGQFGNQGIGGGLFGGGLLGGFGGGLKGFSVGGNLLGPDAQYRNGVGLFGGTPALDGAMNEAESPRREPRPGTGYLHLLLHPVVADSLKGN